MSAGRTSRVHFTICSRNYLAYALTLRDSLAAVDPDEKFVIVLCDPTEGGAVEAIPNLISAEDLGLPYYWEMALRYDVMEFNTAIKPFVMQYFFDQGYKQALYLDPDLYIVRPLEHVYNALRRGATGVLTPHTTVPLDDGLKPSDQTIMQSGIYNLGFGAFTSKPEGRAFVDWWADRCRAECINRIDQGLFVDQKFCDLAPAFMPKLKILHHKGYNTAYWNLASRPVVNVGENGWTSGGEPLHFFHFSGVKPGSYDVFSKHQGRFQVDNIGDLKSLLHIYLDQLDANGHKAFSKIPYAYNQLSDGTDMPLEYRLILNAQGVTNESAQAYFENSDHRLFLRADPVYTQPGLIDIPLIVGAVYRRRVDVQATYSLATNEGRADLMDWFVGGGAFEHHIPKPCIEAAQALWVAVSNQLATQAGSAVRADGSVGVPMAVQPPTVTLKERVKALARATMPPRMWMQIRKAIERHAPAAPRSDPRAYIRVEKGLPFGVGLFGYFMTETGVGEGARNADRALDVAEIPHSRHAITTGGVFNDKCGAPEDFDGAVSEFPINLFHINADQTLRLGELVDPRNLTDRYRIGYWAWELSQFPDAWVPAIENVDEIWAPSKFVADAVRAKTDKHVLVMPHPVVPQKADPARSEFGLPEDKFLVLTSLDLNSFVSRKNPQATIAAFQQAFPEDDNVRLVMKMHGGNRSFDAERAEIVKWIESDDRIIVIDRVLERPEMDSLQETADCFISLHRSEGFGLNVAEMMGRGKPVISTAYSGSNEFVRKVTAYPVSFTMAAVEADQYPFWQGQYWAEPSVRSAAASLREVYARSAGSLEIATGGKNYISINFSYDSIGGQMARRLREVYDEFG